MCCVCNYCNTKYVANIMNDILHTINLDCSKDKVFACFNKHWWYNTKVTCRSLLLSDIIRQLFSITADVQNKQKNYQQIKLEKVLFSQLKTLLLNILRFTSSFFYLFIFCRHLRRSLHGMTF